MSSKLWGGRFDLPTNKLVEEFNATILIEKRLFPVDIHGSIAHATMLAKQGIITQDEADQIIFGLKTVEKEVEEGTFVYDTADEEFTCPLKSA